MSATFWKVFELAISVLENMLLLGFCMDFMQQRPKGKRGKFLWLFAVLVGMIFPALEKYPAIYDRWELWLTLLWLFGYLAVSTRGSILRKNHCCSSCEGINDVCEYSSSFWMQFTSTRECSIFYSTTGYRENCYCSFDENLIFFCGQNFKRPSF